MPPGPPRRGAPPGAVYAPAPALGAHTRDVLTTLGYSERRVAELRERGVV